MPGHNIGMKKFFLILVPFLILCGLSAQEIKPPSEVVAKPTTSEAAIKLDVLESKLSSFEKTKLGEIRFSELNFFWRELASFEFNDNGNSESNSRLEVNKRTDLLIRASKIRSSYLSQYNPELTLNQWFQDSILEVKIIPIRLTTLALNRAHTFRGYFEEGGRGLLKLIPEIMLILLILMLPFLLKMLISKVLELLDKLRLSLVDFRRYRPWREMVALNLQRLTPFIPWVLVIIGFEFLREVMEGTLIEELGLLIPYLLYYCYYRLFRQTVLNLLRLLSEKAMMKASAHTKDKMNRSSLLIGRIYFVVMCLLHTVSSVASEGLLYQEIVVFSRIIGVIVFYRLIWKWREEISGILRRNFGTEEDGGMFAFIPGLMVAKFFIVTGPICFSIALLVPFYHWLEDQIGKFELSKSIAAKIFKKKLENTEGLEGDEEERLPDDYLKYFFLKASEFEEETQKLLVTPKRDPLEKIKVEVNEWKDGKTEEHTVALYGVKGAGKSTTLNRLENFYKDKLKVIRCDIPAKLLTKNEVHKFFGHLLGGGDLVDPVSLLEWDKEIEPTLVILDEAQNLFLAQMGGFEGIRAFFELLNVRTENIFWCASFNRFSWNYLDQVFAKNRYFRSSIEIEGMNEEDLQNLIMKRHNMSSYRLSYAEIIRALRSYSEVDDTSYVENLFFRMLYEESRGNPRVALNLWLRALRPRRRGLIKVGLPLNPKLSVLSRLSEESHFVYSGLIRHENLTSRELVAVTSLAEGVVRYALKIGLENEFIDRDEAGRYRVVALMQGPLTQFLKAKNFIYG